MAFLIGQRGCLKVIALTVCVAIATYWFGGYAQATEGQSKAHSATSQSASKAETVMPETSGVPKSSTFNTKSKPAASKATALDSRENRLWQKRTFEKKVARVGRKILKANGLKNQVGFHVARSTDRSNAFAEADYGAVTIDKGLLNYFENDNELAMIRGA